MKQIAKSLVKRIIPKKFHPQFENCYIKCRYFLLFFFFIGNEFECPFCGGHFRKLLPVGSDIPVLKGKNVVGGGHRINNGKCPRCDSGYRERLVYIYLKNKTTIFTENLKVLHIAPEKSLQKAFKSCPTIDYLSADLNSPLAMVKMDITCIDYEDNIFDLVICNHVLEHIVDDWKAMSELYRVLKSGGWAILQVPVALSLDKTYEDTTATSPEERVKKFGQDDHVRIYGRDYKHRLEKAGFSCIVYNLTSEFGESFAHKYGLHKDENLYICSKLDQRKQTD